MAEEPPPQWSENANKERDKIAALFKEALADQANRYAGLDGSKDVRDADVREAQRTLIRGNRVEGAWKFKLSMAFMEYAGAFLSGVGGAIILNTVSPTPPVGQAVAVAQGQFLPTLPWWSGLVLVVFGFMLFACAKTIEEHRPQKRWTNR